MPRLGQRAFRAVIEVAYDRRCAITGAKILPTLRAAHIRPVEAGGQHRSDNGLLLRADVHVMFDRGYVGVHPRDLTLLVSPMLRSEFGNGEEFYARAGRPIALPVGRRDQPNPESLMWHMDERFST